MLSCSLHHSVLFYTFSFLHLLLFTAVDGPLCQFGYDFRGYDMRFDEFSCADLDLSDEQLGDLRAVLGGFLHDKPELVGEYVATWMDSEEAKRVGTLTRVMQVSADWLSSLAEPSFDL